MIEVTQAEIEQALDRAELKNGKYPLFVHVDQETFVTIFKLSKSLELSRAGVMRLAIRAGLPHLLGTANESE